MPTYVHTCMHTHKCLILVPAAEGFQASATSALHRVASTKLQHSRRHQQTHETLCCLKGRFDLGVLPQCLPDGGHVACADEVAVAGTFSRNAGTLSLLTFSLLVVACLIGQINRSKGLAVDLKDLVLTEARRGGQVPLRVACNSRSPLQSVGRLLTESRRV